MQDNNSQNQGQSSLNTLPPLPETPQNTPAQQPETKWPTKKNNNTLKYVLGGLLAVLIVGGIGFGTFYFSKNLNQADVLTAPSSEPQAALKLGEVRDNGNVIDQEDLDAAAARKAAAKQATQQTAQQAACAATAPTNLKVTNITATSATLTWTPGVGNYVKLWVSSAAGSPTLDCGRLANKVTDKICVANENGVPIGSDPNHADIPATTTSWTVNNLTPSTVYNWRMMMWVVSGCDRAADIVSFTTTAEEPVCTDTSWTPAVNTVCEGTVYTQTSNCGTVRDATGTKTDGDCETCTNETWSPAASTVCEGEEFTQTSSCDSTKERTATGTKTDGDCDNTNVVEGEPSLTVEKIAYEDEDNNASGDYHLNYQMDKVSKNQVFVYAFEITNDGDGKATNIKVTDSLKGNNRDLLSFLDGDSRCGYSSSTRTVTCKGMNLEAGETGVYSFRVKVSSSAINGDIISNAGEIAYSEMASGGETEASNELLISTIVGCNHVCTSDDECDDGTVCDIDTGKCRNLECLDASSCNCPVERVTIEPTKRIVSNNRPQPTELAESGILDFPGVAAFGGGLLLAVVGILLAL